MIEVQGLKFNTRDTFDEETVRDVIIHLDRYRIPKEPKVVIDIGAHIGGVSILCASRGATVYAFEPESENYRMLIENIKLNNLEDKVKCFNLAVSSNPEEVKLYKDFKCNGGHSLYHKNSEEYEIVKTISLKDILEKNNIDKCDFLKIDCEGAEEEIITNTPIEVFKKIDMISLEMYRENGEELRNKTRYFLEKMYYSNIYKHLYYYFYKK